MITPELDIRRAAHAVAAQIVGGRERWIPFGAPAEDVRGRPIVFREADVAWACWGEVGGTTREYVVMMILRSPSARGFDAWPTLDKLGREVARVLGCPTPTPLRSHENPMVVYFRWDIAQDRGSQLEARPEDVPSVTLTEDPVEDASADTPVDATPSTPLPPPTPPLPPPTPTSASTGLPVFPRAAFFDEE